ncbi:secondary thiamine-phosphate synthase enzyme YjbQ [Syntrophorhabdus aromaticivorans]|uniref:YjbQ family protein n=1 Tax=Syntrophorhabdus aromaticivorans TaxID=328301 RepID=A0A351U158_9BACT|nr:secondary thiamine-phosphate synthase enzyme YjbQ [Syntrophorhabdus aromaticivorans]NLW34658.1 YjbQ family protein [Syntrophorhabdus aromaticivorans]HBA53689.1 YjbQ family protein [Syntrophorhabdus aromaticivorans]
MVEIRIKTSRRVEARNITREVSKAVQGRAGSLLHAYTPHTTCGLTINEEADPHVMQDIMESLDRMVPRNYPYKHMEGNSDAHIKSMITGCAVTVPFSQGAPALGTWQGIFLMEFDGPRERKVFITIIE